MQGPLTILSDLSERLHYNVADFPLYTKKDELSRYGYAALCHWHPDLEYIYIEKGTMDYFVNGKIIHMEQGQGIFVNSRRLHYGFSKERQDCTFIALVIHPRIFIQNTQTGNDYMKRKFSMANPDYIFLDPMCAWQKSILRQIITVHQYMDMIKEDPLLIMMHAIHIVEMTGKQIVDQEKSESDLKDQMCFLEMTSYIENHYGERITLDILSKAGAVSRSKACDLFQQFVKDTPNHYLQSYRIEKSAQLLRDTNLSITEISAYCGFTTPSYYTSVFHSIKNMKPKDYRKNMK